MYIHGRNLDNFYGLILSFIVRILYSSIYEKIVKLIFI